MCKLVKVFYQVKYNGQGVKTLPFTLLKNILSENKLFTIASNIIHPETQSDLVVALTFVYQ